MAKGKRNKPAPERAASAKPVHGPTQPRRYTSGLERLRAMLNLSDMVDADGVCQAAAAEIDRLRHAPRRDLLEPAEYTPGRRVL